MFKATLTLLGLLAMAACVDVDGGSVTRDYTGSLNGCPGLTGVSAVYSQGAPGLPVRCGPQTAAPVTYNR